LELFDNQSRLSPNENERKTTMKLIYSLFLLVTLSLLIKNDGAKQPLFTASEIREVNQSSPECNRMPVSHQRKRRAAF
jgi:hypothetical protein